MESILLQALETTNVQETSSQFPFLAALILVAIIVVVSVGDKVLLDKKGKGTKEQSNKDKDNHAQR
ncbi:MAG: hypothetical protein U0L26_11015 [Cellulosilyticum sp.]|nr:hypothetical protein [Cellulosilyticum sp.]MEE1072882.1 hypothetical protein [Cellulosilyticum sp.]